MSVVVTFTSSGRTDEQPMDASSTAIDGTLNQPRLRRSKPGKVMFPKRLIEFLRLCASFLLRYFLLRQLLLKLGVRCLPLFNRTLLGAVAGLLHLDGELCGRDLLPQRGILFHHAFVILQRHLDTERDHEDGCENHPNNDDLLAMLRCEQGELRGDHRLSSQIAPNT